VTSFALAGAPATRPTTTPSFNAGYITDPAIPESSGLVASRRHAGVFWTHNDSGNRPLIFAIDRAGKTIGSFPVRQRNRDWEDIAIDDAGHLYIGEIGNNFARHKQLAVYQIDEPDPRRPLTPGASLPVLQTWQLRFPEKPFDCESLFVWKDYGYVISKLFDGRDARLYRFALSPQTRPAVLEWVGDLAIRFPCTGADLSQDGKRLAVMTVAGPYLFELPRPGDVSHLADVEPRHVFYTDVHMEAVAFTDAGLLATSESRSVYFFSWKDFGDARMKPDHP
jgi:hypothetical protein